MSIPPSGSGNLPPGLQGAQGKTRRNTGQVPEKTNELGRSVLGSRDELSNEEKLQLVNKKIEEHEENWDNHGEAFVQQKCGRQLLPGEDEGDFHAKNNNNAIREDARKNLFRVGGLTLQELLNSKDRLEKLIDNTEKGKSALDSRVTTVGEPIPMEMTKKLEGLQEKSKDLAETLLEVLQEKSKDLNTKLEEFESEWIKNKDKFLRQKLGLQDDMGDPEIAYQQDNIIRENEEGFKNTFKVNGKFLNQLLSSKEEADGRIEKLKTELDELKGKSVPELTAMEMAVDNDIASLGKDGELKGKSVSELTAMKKAVDNDIAFLRTQYNICAVVKRVL